MATDRMLVPHRRKRRDVVITAVCFFYMLNENATGCQSTSGAFSCIGKNINFIFKKTVTSYLLSKTQTNEKNDHNTIHSLLATSMPPNLYGTREVS